MDSRGNISDLCPAPGMEAGAGDAQPVAQGRAAVLLPPTLACLLWFPSEELKWAGDQLAPGTQAGPGDN